MTSSLWHSYIPHHVAAALLADPEVDPVGREQRFDAVALFVDVSGFTAMSEALAVSGKTGAEELTALLNHYFEPMIDLIQSFGGIIGKFGGDAMTVLFPYEAESQRDVCCRALQCALNMMKAMAGYEAIQTRGGTFTLAMKAGLAYGSLFCTTVGNPEVRLEYIIAGRVLDMCAEAEHHANKGDVIVHDSLLPLLGDVEIKDSHDGFSRVTALLQPASPNPLDPLGELPANLLKLTSAYLHPSIAQRLMQGQASFINEHRKVTVLFVRFENLDYDNDPEVGQKLQSYLSEVIRTIHDFDGYLAKVDMGDKGSKYLVLFGAPIAHQNDVSRALQCAFELRALEGPASRIGINSGFVYCGQVGSSVRQEYTVMGDAVNLTARLMQAAEAGEILVSDSTHHAAIGSFVWEPAKKLTVKGKSEPVRVYTLLGIKERGASNLRETKYALPMVGRQKELQWVKEHLSLALGGQGQIVGITAEPGMGKTRLIDEIIRLALQQGISGYASECLSHGAHSYHVWKDLLRGLFGLDGTWSLQRRLRHLEAQLAGIDPSLVPRMPLLSRLLNLPIPENALTSSMEAKLRKESREALVVDCMRYFSHQQPFLLVLEDCQWIDPLSHDLLVNVARNLSERSILMVLAYRSPDTEWLRPRVTRFGHFREIQLTDFTREEAAQLIGLKLAQFFGTHSSVPVDLLERVTERAQGNPFYIDEMINLIHDRQIDPTDNQALQALELPDSLHSLIISRIDQLNEGIKSTLKVASVIGRVFKENWLAAVYPSLGSAKRVHEQLTTLTQLDLTVPDKIEPELEYLFKHIVTREVAYESLAVATRTMLHERVGNFIEEHYPERLEQYLDLLAYHYSLSANLEKQRDYFRRAGVAAQANYDNEAALSYYQALLRLLPEAEQGIILLNLGQVRQLVGRWAEAEESYRKALRVAGELQERPLLAKSQRALGTLLRSKGNYGETLLLLQEAKTGFETIHDPHSALETLIDIGVLYWLQGDYTQALAYFQQALEEARTRQDALTMCRALGNLGLIYIDQNDHENALAVHEQGLEIAERLQDRMKSNVLIGNLGGFYLKRGKYERALAYYLQSLQAATELGYRQGINISLGNIGNVYLEQGEYDNARACFIKTLQIALEIGDRVGVSLTLFSLALGWVEQDNYEEAVQFIQPAIALARLIDTPYDLCEYLYIYGDMLTQQEDYLHAQEINTQALEMALEVEQEEIQFQAQLQAIRLKYLLGELRPAEAREAFEALGEEGQNERNRAALHYQIWRVVPTLTEHREKVAALYRSLYEESPNIEYQRRYEELTRERLPAPPPLAPLPDIVLRHPPSLDGLLRQVEALLEVST
ncbi:MAG: tetratricopeptide repeat protein [Ardenticatenales bacterium]|nr:tetratricopeptide repeat protein [Ardenticatenales bacterium]